MKGFFCTHSLLPLAMIVITMGAFTITHIDLLLADTIYAAQGYQWQLKSSWLLEDVIHKGGRNLVALLFLINTAALISTWFSSRMRPYRLGLGYLLAITMTSMLIISGLKGITHIDCPWSFKRYGGEQPYATLDSMMFGSGNGRCYPAGHASGGYAWIALYFFCDIYKPQWRKVALGFGLLLGLTFGIAQQIRGAHFLSHDLTTLAICWYIALAGYYVLHIKYSERLSWLKSRGISEKMVCYNCGSMCS